MHTYDQVNSSEKNLTSTDSIYKQPQAVSDIPRAAFNPDSLSVADIMMLQNTIGNQAVIQLLKSGQFTKTNQADPSMVNAFNRENETGLPDNLKNGIENLSGISMNDVAVHYNSNKPASMEALAYTQGTDIYIAPGQEHHLGHEAWHVIQQKQGRVKPPIPSMVPIINDEPGLEKEAALMGDRARHSNHSLSNPENKISTITGPPVIQQCKKLKFQIGQHGARRNEQKRLSKKFGTKVTGDSHESEHTVGFEALNRSSGLKRGKAVRSRHLESKAPAYQEAKRFHRAHIGTGMKGPNPQVDLGFSSSQLYRDSQRSLLETGGVSTAVQLNQLGYAFMPDFQDKTQQSQPAFKAATESFNTMVEGMDSFTYAQGDQDMDVAMGPEDKAEMYLSRQAALQGEWPSADQFREAREKFEVK